jgi:putative NADPH-quinone reductase
MRQTPRQCSDNIMAKRILILLGHPDPAPERLCRALAEAYADGARAGGHEVRLIDIAKLDVPVLRSKDEFEKASPSPAIKKAQEDMLWAEHHVIIYPLWLGTMPALLKAFFEQVGRPGFAYETTRRGWKKLLKGKSARIVVTMGMPALVYRLYFGAHSLKSLERNILGFIGIAPIRESLFGLIEMKGRAKKALATMRAIGMRAA